MDLVDASDEFLPGQNSCDPGEECDGICKECNLSVRCELELKVDRVHSTRRSFLLELDGLGATIVVSKKDASGFSGFGSVEISPELAEQVENLNLELSDAQYLFCRTWRGRSRRYCLERRYFYPCAREQANFLLVVGKVDCEMARLDYHNQDEVGAVNLNRVSSYSEEGYEGRIALDIWTFQYNPETDRLQIPPDEMDQKIDRMIELLEKEA